MASTLLSIICFLLIFTVIVVSHEFGHFLLGRINGIEVEEFAIGMGPAIFKKKFKHTTLAIRILPIGGACVFKGMYDEDALDTESSEESEEAKALEIIDDASDNEVFDGSFNKASVGARMATVAAGPVFNIILAFLLSIVLCWFCGQDMPVTSGIVEDSAAEKAGLQEGDRIVKINGESIHIWREVSLISMLNNGEPLNITYKRDGKTYKTKITPEYSEEDKRYYIGIRPSTTIKNCKNLAVFPNSVYEVEFWLKATYKSLIHLLSGKGSMDDLAGPVGVTTVVNDTIETAKPFGAFVVLLEMINIAVLLSVNLGVLNFLPFPAIDGGRFLLLLWEAITKKPVPQKAEAIIHMIGFIILMILMVAVLFNDIARIF